MSAFSSAGRRAVGIIHSSTAALQHCSSIASLRGDLQPSTSYASRSFLRTIGSTSDRYQSNLHEAHNLMLTMSLARALIALNLSIACTEAFTSMVYPLVPKLASRVRATDLDAQEYIGEDLTGVQATERLELKSKLFAAAAACDRGFAAFTGSQERSRLDVLVGKLSALNPNLNPTRGLVGSDEPNVGCALEANWRLVYTTAYDVLSLGASPFTALEGIYQDIAASGDSINIIDLCPRIQVALPVPMASTLRINVKTKARARSPTRVGLTFVAADFGPLRLLGQSTDFLPRVGGKFPSIGLFGNNVGADDEADINGPSYFDIIYLDEDMLIIKQNEPGGIFVSVRDRELIM